jgi:hypothetical protein
MFNLSTLRRQLIALVSILLVTIMVTPALAQPCDAAGANAKLEDAKTSLEAGNTESATTLINEAQALLSSCADAATSGAGSTETTTSANATINIPEVDPEAAITYIAFAHTSPDVGPIDLYTNDVAEPIISNLAFGEATELFPFEAGARTFTARAAGSDSGSEALATSQKDYAANSSWIFTAAGLNEKVSFITEPMSVVRNAYNDQARVRIVNFVPDTNIDVVDANGTDFGTGLGWIGMQDMMVDEGSYTLQVNANGQPFMEPATFDVAANNTYTLFVIGQPGSDAAVQILPIVIPQETGRMQFISTRGDAVDIHYRPGDERIIENLGAGVTSDWVTLEAGAITFIAYAPGTGPTGTELAGVAFQLRPGYDVTISVNDNEMVVTEETFTGAQNEE